MKETKHYKQINVSEGPCKIKKFLFAHLIQTTTNMFRAPFTFFMRERERERKYKDMITHPTKKREHDEYSLSNEFIQGERVSEK